MTSKLTITALALAVMGCGAPASNGTSAEGAVAPANANNEVVAPSEMAIENAVTPVPSQGSNTRNDGLPRAIRFGDRSTVQLQALKIDVREGLSDGKCAVLIGDQRIATVGSGDLEVYTCGVLVDAGALPPAGGARRIGLIYRVSSPNAQFQTALVLVEQGDRWTLDPESVGTHDDSPEAKSIEALVKSVSNPK